MTLHDAYSFDSTNENPRTESPTRQIMTSRVSPETWTGAKLSIRMAGALLFEVVTQVTYSSMWFYTDVTMMTMPRRLCSRPNRMEITTEASTSMTLIRDQGCGLTGIQPCACYHANMKVGILPSAYLWFCVEGRIFQLSGVTNFYAWYSRALLPIILTVANALNTRHLYHRLLTVWNVLGGFPVILVNDLLGEVQNSFYRCSFCWVEPVTQVLIVFNDGRIRNCDMHLKPGDNSFDLMQALFPAIEGELSPSTAKQSNKYGCIPHHMVDSGSVRFTTKGVENPPSFKCEREYESTLAQANYFAGTLRQTVFSSTIGAFGFGARTLGSMSTNNRQELQMYALGWGQHDAVCLGGREIILAHRMD
ncbi:hypothetical protein EDD18DRAFT_1439690 [Armillaria luteobubalina]|uniref:Uncharacterized protein n=1 Tax=Armillaria luteobubalina TaxID=153913 RepID=A0AA39PBN7_9AGAR|nr:hypothetical protein EDD18DRAFT_1439690 [Armillaria luteobubalina]